MATIEKITRSDGTAYKAVIRKRGQGQGKISKTFKSRKAAERWARKTEAGIEENRAGLIDQAALHTLAQAVTKYRADVLPEKRPETARKYEQHLDHWTDALGHLRLSEVTAVKIAEARDALTTAGKAPATVNRYLATLASVLTACVRRWHWLGASPMTQVQKPTERNHGTRFLSDDEAARLLKACRESESQDLYLAVLLSLTTGARQGEILSLRWQDLDLSAGTMVVRAEAETTTKGGARALPIVPEALTLLQARDKARRAAQQSGKVASLRPSDAAFVFPSRVTKSKPVSLRTPWETALRRAGIDGFRWHDLRHSAASFLAKGGASLLEIGAVLGHKSANTTKRYSHLTETHTADLVRTMAGKLLGTAGSEQ
jgi:integrase